MRVPFTLQKLFGSVTWRMPVTDPVLFLTFDDGPVPEVTLQVLDILERFNAKATFFCTGENVQKHSDIFRKVLAAGHSMGNHTYHHLNGWRTGAKDYIQDVSLCDEVLFEMVHSPQSTVHNPHGSPMEDSSGSLSVTVDRRPSTFDLFRPPYGKLSWSQYSNLKSQYSIIMWDVLSEDYNQKISGEKCFQNVIRHARNGSIIVFHDSIKAKERVLYALPKVLGYFSKQNFSFRAIPHRKGIRG